MICCDDLLQWSAVFRQTVIRVVNCTWHDAVREGLIKLLLSSSRISARMNDLIHSTVDSRRLIIIVRSKLGEPIFSKIKPVWEIFVKNLLLRLQWRIESHHATPPQEISMRPLSFTRDFDDLFFSQNTIFEAPLCPSPEMWLPFFSQNSLFEGPLCPPPENFMSTFFPAPLQGFAFPPPSFPRDCGGCGIVDQPLSASQ